MDALFTTLPFVIRSLYLPYVLPETRLLESPRLEFHRLKCTVFTADGMSRTRVVSC